MAVPLFTTPHYLKILLKIRRHEASQNNKSVFTEYVIGINLFIQNMLWNNGLSQELQNRQHWNNTLYFIINTSPFHLPTN